MTPPLRRLVSRHRRALAAPLVGVAVLIGLASVAPPRPPVRAVVVAARDLAAGRLLAADDLRVASLPAAMAPDGALSDPAELTGRSLAGAVRRGEPLTDLRLVGPRVADRVDGSGRRPGAAGRRRRGRPRTSR